LKFSVQITIEHFRLSVDLLTAEIVYVSYAHFLYCSKSVGLLDSSDFAPLSVSS